MFGQVCNTQCMYIVNLVISVKFITVCRLTVRVDIKISHYKNTTDHYFGHKKWLSEQDIKQNTVTKDEHMHMFHNVAIIWT